MTGIARGHGWPVPPIASPGGILLAAVVIVVMFAAGIRIASAPARLEAMRGPAIFGMIVVLVLYVLGH